MSNTPKQSVVSIRNKSLTFYQKWYGEGNKKPILNNLIQFKNEGFKNQFSSEYDKWLFQSQNNTDSVDQQENYSLLVECGDSSGMKYKLAESETEVKKQADYNGFISIATKRKVSKYLETWVEAVKSCKSKLLKQYYDQLPYFTFVTLTLPSEQKHHDRFIKKNILSRWIEKEQKKGTFKYFFWRAEAQSNGNIHFHLLVDKYINHEYLRNSWNQSCEVYGYVSAYANRMRDKFRRGFFFDRSLRYYDRKEKKYKILDIDSQRRSYKRGVEDNWENPNSTDIRKIKSIKDLSSYLLKYFTKNEKSETRGRITCIHNRKIEGRIIGKSKGLETIEPICISEFDDSFLAWYRDARTNRLMEKEIDIVGNGSIVVVLGKFMASIKRSALYRHFLWYHLGIIKKMYLPELNPPEIMDMP